MFTGEERSFSPVYFLLFWRCSVINTKGVQINEDIRDAEIRLIGENGEQLGIFSAKDAQKMAVDRGLDLVKIAPMATPPVCKIMDYNKFYFEKTKREKEAKKKQKVIVLKEVQLSLNIEMHDFNTKLKHALRFLGGGNKVKVTLRLRSREIQRPELGIELLNKFAEGAKEIGNVEKAAKLETRTLIMILAPKVEK